MDITYLKGVGPKRAELYRKLGIETAEQLIELYPRDYVDLTAPVTVAQAHIGEVCAFRAFVMSKRSPFNEYARMALYKAELSDSTGNITAVFFNTKYAFGRLETGREYIFYGKITGDEIRKQISTPLFVDVSENVLMPKYPLTAGLSNNMVSANVKTALLDESISFVRRNMKTATCIDPQTGRRSDKPEYPVVAVRELILNALVHRDYSTHTDYTPVTIRMFSNRIEIENPGGLYGRMTLDKLGKVAADTRNPFLANALEVIDVTENRYSGIPTVYSAMKNAGLPEPKFENERGIFRATLYNSAEIPAPVTGNEEDLLIFCRTPRTRAEIEQHFKGRLSINYLMAHIIRPLVEQGKIKLAIPDKPRSKNQKYYS